MSVPSPDPGRQRSRLEAEAAADQHLHDAEPRLTDLDFEGSVAHGLCLRPRRIASRWLYDDVGAALFGDIVASPDYDVPHAERQIPAAHDAGMKADRSIASPIAA